ncbi:MAG TPA: hypothetical protein VHC21_01815 [Candidatus Saccharimonadales bacterium]|nr:hypothetical protein [Candidatus Saccharimonadales bacterium]
MNELTSARRRWQDGEFLHAAAYLDRQGNRTPLVEEIGAQILRERTRDIRFTGGRLLHRAAVGLHLINIDEAELLEAGARLEAAGWLKLEREASVVAALQDRTPRYFVRLGEVES